FRRDFTINTMAIKLNPSHYGELIDLYEGRDDLKHKLIRVLHEKSFTDDATRIWRGAGLSPGILLVMGVRGAALATVIAQLLGAGLSFYYVVARKSVYRVKLLYLRPSLSILRDIYRVGFPSMIMQVMEGVSFAVFNYVLSAFGSLALAAAGIA
ncbi:unnamed protein product, partial [marine sediment metagenome]